MRRRTRMYLWLVGLVLAAGYVTSRFLSPIHPVPAKPPGPRPAAAPGAALPVYTHQVQPRTLEEKITATGTLVADESVDLVSELAGKVVGIAFEEDSRVRRGQVLVRIDDTELRAQLRRAESRAELARLQEKRQQQLGVGVGTTQDALDAAASERRVLEAEAAVVRTQLAKMEIRAPFDGLIGLRYVSEGAYVTPTTRLASLQRIDPIKIDFSVAERHLERLRRDETVQVSVAGIAEPFSGRIYAIEPRIDPTTRMLRVRAVAPNPGGRALPGGFATVEVPLQSVPNALMVPADALITNLGGAEVYVVENGYAMPRRVETGLRLSREVQVRSGLRAGDIVITSGQLQLRPNVPVQPLGERPATAEADDL